MFAVPFAEDNSAYGPITFNYEPITLEMLSDTDLVDASLYQHVLQRANDLDILNLSFGYQGNIENYSDTDLRKNYNLSIAALAQNDGRPDKTILVWAAGNEANSSPEILAGLVARASELQDHSIAVVSTGENGTLSEFSNRCGIAKDFCIAAPGEQLLAAAVIYNNISYYGLVDGTSFSAPMVSGGLVVMKKLFRDSLSSEELVERLLTTANNEGIYADADTYGRGLMDLGAATNPWGVPAFMEANASPTGTGTPITASAVALGTPLGDSLPEALASQEIAAFDALGAPFWFDASNFTVPAAGVSVATGLQRFLNPAVPAAMPTTWQFSLQEDAPALEVGHLGLTGGASRFTVASPQGITAMALHAPDKLEGLTLAWTPTSWPAFTFSGGYLHEQHTLLGSRASGAFGGLAGDTTFLAAGLNTPVGDWQLDAEAELGWVAPSLASSQFITALSTLSTSAFRLQAARPFANGSTLRLSLAQPLRVDRGTASLFLPTGRTRDGTVVGTALNASLSPSGRQLDLTAAVEFPGLGGDVSLGATRSQHPRHRQAAAPEWILFTGYSSAW